MTTNQTIEGVPRELLELCVKALGSTGYTFESNKLRALLDAPIPFPGYPPVPEDRKLPAAQPQGVPVAYRWRVKGHDNWTASVCKVEFDARANDDRFVAQALYAEQPAPLAVAYQYRQRPLWRKDDNSGWMPWKDCSQEAHADYTASPNLHDWQYETRTLYAGPNQQ